MHAFVNAAFSFLSPVKSSGTANTAAARIPPHPTLPKLRSAAAVCTACPLYAHAAQTVFGEGPARAAMMLIGEIPGDHGQWVSSSWASQVLATFHPSALLRAQDEDRDAKISLFIKDLKKAAAGLKAAA